MFFVASKIFGFLTLPSNLLFTLALIGILLMATRFVKLGRVLLVGAVLLLVLVGLGPVGNWLIYPLEQRFPKWDHSRGAPDGIIILGGTIGPENSAARGEPALNESAERLTAVAGLARRYPQVPVVFTGGNASLLQTGRTEAQFARGLLESFGIAPDRIKLEDRSRTTAENATFTKALVNPKPGERWLLVTSAHHMPRSVGVFRAANFPVEAYPVDWRTAGPDDLYTLFSTFPSGLGRADAAMHEWAGLLAYWLTGRISEFFPGPHAGAGCDRTKDNCRP
jgi:uncharacterized SAM-binding protein YcdF (DUF218 family)